MCSSVVVTIEKEMKIPNLDNYVNKRHKLCRLKETFSYYLMHISCIAYIVMAGCMFRLSCWMGGVCMFIFRRDTDDFIAGGWIG